MEVDGFQMEGNQALLSQYPQKHPKKKPWRQPPALQQPKPEPEDPTMAPRCTKHFPYEKDDTQEHRRFWGSQQLLD